MGGVVLRAGAGPVREAWLDALRACLPPGTPWRRCPPAIPDERLIGGLDLPATLAAGRPVLQSGLLAEADGGIVVVPMAERLAPGTAARLAACLDAGRVVLSRDGFDRTLPARIRLVLLDEGREPDEAVPEGLADRLAFRLDLTGLRVGDLGDPTEGQEPDDAPEPDPAAALCAIAEAFGIASLRAPLLALRAARRATASGPIGRARVIEAARLVLAPRATRLPAPAPEEGPDDAAQEASQGGSEDGPSAPPDSLEADAPPLTPETPPDDGAGGGRQAEDVVLEAVRAAIPGNLLAQLLAGGPRLAGPRAGRAGAPAAGRAGRPVGSRPGDPRRGRLDLLGTLRAAAPWQRLRAAEAPLAGKEPGIGIRLRPEDVRVRVLRQRTETTTVFCVDASGSAALERLAEAKGAVELLLAEAYVRRDRVALVSFRGAGAEVVLPPTRSLVRAKRALSGLPGGGGTPLAAGIEAALGVALAVRRGGGRPVLVLLTDGRANVRRSGLGGRTEAGAEAVAAARAVRGHGLAMLVIDTGVRGEGARAVAEAAGARYCPLPHADAGTLSAAVRAATA